MSHDIQHQDGWQIHKEGQTCCWWAYYRDPSILHLLKCCFKRECQGGFLLAALNDLEVFAADVGNAYLNAPCREKNWTRAGKEFGSDKGCIMIIVRALYGLKTSGAA